ncbi:hypothetical protein [Mobilicoccus caccae]|uniref:Uncharacterized protein n=1 Tax=Mobilicoccus caccae TaxID=1859295 RepID=A0ABQ6IVJ2_9MICO|nr:hypothetical protein [Mobilicoccus caccae]GMA41922.1 hypothetical protein GCM10025883_39670 [Mobilicoccus caccae]
MGLTDVLARAAVRRSHVLVIEVRGRWRTRVAVERAVASRGWLLALSPADADVVAVCGHPGPQLAEAVERVWHEMPGPRVRVDVADEAEVASRLDEARTALLDTPRHHDDARTRPFAADLIASNSADTDDEASSGDGDDGTADEGSGEDNGQGGGCDQGQHDGHQGHDAHGDMDHGDMDHGDMDHGDMEMAPGGIPLAGGAEDRDGLEMDVLEVPLGPVLPHWPPGSF